MPISFVCPHCGATSQVADQYAGQQGPCSSCGQTIAIPAQGVAVPNKSSSKTALIVILVVALPFVLFVCMGIIGVLVALLLPAIQAAREAANRAQCLNNVRQIVLAMHNYNAMHGTFPPAYIPDENGQPMHSWRVLLLPYLERNDIYQQYDFDQPWDSPHNKQVVASIELSIFTCPSGDNIGGTTSYMVVTGQGTMFEGSKACSLANINDGSSYTIMIVEVPSSGRHWAEPVDISADELIEQFEEGTISQAGNHPGGINVGFADGSGRFLSGSMSSDGVKAITTKNANDQVPLGY